MFDLPAIAFETLSSIWALFFFSEVLIITKTLTGVAGGPARSALEPV
jgi:hypothetical protein